MWEAVSAMGEQDKNLMEVIYEIKERLVRMEEKLNRFDKIEDKADKAQETATQAMSLGQENSRDIDGIRKALYWGFGFIITLAITLLVELVKK
jgi:hypothetical protein